MVIRAVIEMTKREEKTLTEFLSALQMERDAIISFSLDGIIAGNNKKEEILRKLEYLKAEKEKLMENAEDREAIVADETMRSLNGQLAVVMKEVKTAMDKNMKLLSFSIDHVRSSIENIIGHISNVGYGKKREDLSSVLLSKVI
ncbi:MAG: flagellar export chaperone FlgN [Syntrophorhabdaceae bacterium]|nr:flagellar export chaperone FlgN [Syntrophorhabdaceae bacterium]